jgi:Glycosyltransferase
MSIIGFERTTYAENKQFLYNRNTSFSRVNSEKLDSLPSYFTDKDKEWCSIVNHSRVDIIHYFNQINYGAVPFGTTFETTVPRHWSEQAISRGTKIILSEKCKFLIAMSENAKKLQEERCNHLSSEEQQKLEDKTVVLHTPQEIIPNDISRFSDINPLRIIFIGYDFYRKGGFPMLRALEQLNRLGYKFHLTVVSDVTLIDINYNITDADLSTVELVLDYFVQNHEWIEWKPNLPNDDVIAMLPNYHLGMLPSFAETYGYTVLEMQAAGIPVITTNVGAFPEINPENCGWQITLPAQWRENKARSLIVMQNSIFSIIRGIFDAPDILTTKSCNSVDKIIALHCPIKHAAKLQRIYSAACP